MRGVCQVPCLEADQAVVRLLVAGACIAQANGKAASCSDVGMGFKHGLHVEQLVLPALSPPCLRHCLQHHLRGEKGWSMLVGCGVLPGGCDRQSTPAWG